MPVDEVHEIIKSPAFPFSSVEDFVLYPSKESFTYRCVKGAIYHVLIIPKVMLLISILSNDIEHCVTFFLNCITLFINPITVFEYCKTIFKGSSVKQTHALCFYHICLLPVLIG